MSSTKLNDQIETILITGGSGLVGSHLSALLTTNDYKVTHLSRSVHGGDYRRYQWDLDAGTIDEEAIKGADAIIHLAGAGVADKRWSKSYKKEIYDSRIESTRLLREKIVEINPQLKYFLSASAIGFYGWDSGKQLMDEASPRGDGFLADVVEDWELETAKFQKVGIAHGWIRIGIVLSGKAGALVEMSKPIRLGVGAPLGDGGQFMSWIHIDDLVRMMAHMVEQRTEGAINGVAPEPTTNKDFTRKLANQLQKPLWLPNVPKFALRLLVGEMADILVGGNNVSSKKIETSGFKFQFSTLEEALQDLL